ncbi:hypothetical protein [Amygdalobacter nucleatus]|uniref:hypothetical protein n=1 Tax=Amygdalobacter nucleatus TaxID=3029274 RepID=UPI0027A8DBDF|nr:hypothetical protein [Amygdalobacter nucleatus]WEG36359.1 hypothetical protein PYS63_04165 [Amygdalobacter nucleatus]
MQQTIYVLNRFTKRKSDYANILETNLHESYPMYKISLCPNFSKFMTLAKQADTYNSIFIFCPEYLEEANLNDLEAEIQTNSVRYLAIHEYTDCLHLTNAEVKELTPQTYAFIDGFNYLVSLANWPKDTLIHKYSSWQTIQAKLNSLFKQTNKIMFSSFLNFPYSQAMNKSLLSLCQECQKISAACIYVPLVDPLEYAEKLRPLTNAQAARNVWLDYSFAEASEIDWSNYLQATKLNNTTILNNTMQISSHPNSEVDKVHWQNFWQSLTNYCQANAYHLVCQIGLPNEGASISCLKHTQEIYVQSKLIDSNLQYGSAFNWAHCQSLLSSSCKVNIIDSLN